MSRPFADGDVIAHYQNGHINAIYTRMEERWSRSPGGYAVGPDDDWNDILDQGLDGEAEHESGYVFVGNVRHLAANLMASQA